MQLLRAEIMCTTGNFHASMSPHNLYLHRSLLHRRDFTICFRQVQLAHACGWTTLVAATSRNVAQNLSGQQISFGALLFRDVDLGKPCLSDILRFECCSSCCACLLDYLCISLCVAQASRVFPPLLHGYFLRRFIIRGLHGNFRHVGVICFTQLAVQR